MNSANLISLFRGDTFDSTVEVNYITIVNGEVVVGNAVDLTGYTAKFTAKKRPDQADASAVISKSLTISDAANGIITVSLTHLETDLTPGIYYYDVQIVNTVTSKVHTVVVDVLKISADVTRTSIAAT